MKLRELGEFELIERMAAIFRQADPIPREPPDPLSRLSTGIGDDAAVWNNVAGYTVATTDAMVENVHFTRSTTGWYDLGWKAMASNISDVAGMGGIPRYALAVLGAPSDLTVEDALALCQGMADLAAQFGAVVVGGDTVSSPVAMVTVTVLGDTLPGATEDDRPLLLSRFAARPGDAIAVTGRLGSSAGGLELLLHRRQPVPDHLKRLIEAHRRPMPRVREGQLLVQAGVRCGMDLSDGIVGDLTRICRASHVAARVEVEKLPMDPLLVETFGHRAVEMALSGGEDYELLCIAPSEIVERARLLLEGCESILTVVGWVSEAEQGRPAVLLVDAAGRASPPERSGWEHFKEVG